MFYQTDPEKVTKDSVNPLAYIYTLNRIDLMGKEFEFTCPEAGIKCNRFFFHRNNIAQPPCCLKILTGMAMARVVNWRIKYLKSFWLFPRTLTSQ